MLIGIFRTWLSKHPLRMAGKSSLRVTVTNTYTNPYMLIHKRGWMEIHHIVYSTVVVLLM